MKTQIHVRRNATGEIRVCEDQYPWDEYQWVDGNFACDCNRHLLFERAAGIEPDEERPCGSTLYTIVKVVDQDGQEIKYEEKTP